MGRWSDYIWWTEFMATLSGPLRVREREDPLQLALRNSLPEVGGKDTLKRGSTGFPERTSANRPF